jgi:carbonic anhydrase/acetyltransferase-like protein (isoleucine patch superfamily)
LKEEVAKGLRGWSIMRDRLRSSLLIAWYRALYPGLRTGGGVTFERGVHVVVTRGASLTIDDGVRVERYCQLIVSGALIIGPGSFVGTGSIIAASERVEIGKDALIAAYTMIRDNDHAIDQSGLPYCRQGLVSSPVSIGDNVWIGAKSTVLRGVTIGHNAVVGANAVVSSDVEASTLVGGVPARLIKRLGDRHARTRRPSGA